MAYQTLEQLQQSKAKLHETVVLDENMQLAFWSNQQDRVSVCSDHHTLSLYIQDGYESYQKTPAGWKNGGGPGRFCLLPEHQSQLGTYVVGLNLSTCTTPTNICVMLLKNMGQRAESN